MGWEYKWGYDTEACDGEVDIQRVATEAGFDRELPKDISEKKDTPKKTCGIIPSNAFHTERMES